MGTEQQATCNRCGNEFTISEGGGFVFHLLHCEQCGKEKSVLFHDLGELHFRYLKGLSVPYSIATWESDTEIQHHYPGEPLAKADYQRRVEEFAGSCECGGGFRFEAPPRCPKCRSDSFTRDPSGPSLYYD